MTYKIEFSNDYVGGPSTKVTDFGFFNDDNGYDDLDRAAVATLTVGASLQLDNSGQTVTRLASPGDHLREQSVARMQQEILADLKDKRFDRADIRCFGDLHNFVDANEYGGYCEDQVADALIAAYGGRDEHGDLPSEFVEHVNGTQDTVSQWLARGGLYIDAGPLVFELTHTGGNCTALLYQTKELEFYITDGEASAPADLDGETLLFVRNKETDETAYECSFANLPDAVRMAEILRAVELLLRESEVLMVRAKEDSRA